MPYAVPSAADLAARFPAFADVPSSVRGEAIAEASTRVDETWMPGDYAIAILLLAAHTLTLDGRGHGPEAAAAGMAGFRSVRSGSLILDRDPVQAGGSPRGSSLEATSYGRRFLALLKVNRPAVAVP